MKALNKTALIFVAATSLASTAQAADLAIMEPTTFAAEPAGGSWEGFYIGVHGGYASGLADHQPAIPVGPGGNGFDINVAGAFGGVQAGGNFYLSDTIVGGIEADLSLANITGSTPGFGGTINYKVNWTGSVRARLGYDAGQFLPYVTGGVAFANATRTTLASDTQTYVGWTVGAGVEYAATDSLSLGLEYRYSDYGNKTFATGGTPPSIKLTDHQVRIGLNYRF